MSVKMTVLPKARQRFQLQSVAVCVAAVSILAVSACTAAGEGAIDSPPPESSSADTETEKFDQYMPEDVCPGWAEVIPEDLTAPPEFEYQERSGEAAGHWASLTCSYLVVDNTGAVDGLQLIDGLSLSFIIRDDGLPAWSEAHFDPPLDFEEEESATYFQDWDAASFKQDFDGPGSSHTESDEQTYQFFASLDNLYVSGNAIFLVTEEDFDPGPPAFEAWEAIASAVVPELKRV